MRVVMWIAAAIMAIVVSLPAFAADVKVATYSNTGKTFLIFEGAVEEGDLKKLQKQYWANQKANEWIDLQLSSPGGHGAEMKKIAEWLSTRNNIVTVVSGSRECYSACAVMWLHGAKKAVAKTATIGFHVSSMAITPETVEFLDAYQGGYGHAGVQQLIQDNYADDIKYYFDMDVANPYAFAAEIAMASGGYNFWTLSEDNAWIVGNVIWF